MNDDPRCGSCGETWKNHLGCEGLCRENIQLKIDLNEREKAARWLYDSDGDAHSKVDASKKWLWLEQ